MKRALARLLISFGIFCLTLNVVLYWERTNPQRLSFTEYMHNHPKTTVKASNPPVRMIVKGLEIDLPVIPAKVTSGTWETTTQGVSYLATSPVPGDVGNSIMYGHNWTNLLGDLVHVRPGDQIVLIYKDSSRKTFTVELTGIVSPDQTHILSPTKDRRITLYTCTGFMDSKRFVATAILRK